MKNVILFLLIFVVQLISSGCDRKQKPLNFVVFLIDDLGWTDLSGSGSDLYETPNIDRLATEGVRFSQAYAACTVCSPTRAALMTGKYPARLHLTDWITGHKRPKAKLRVPDWQMYLDTAEATLAELLKTSGYSTANIGKWHLGNDPLYWPENQGFDVNIGGYRWGAPGSYFYPYQGNSRDGVPPPNLESGEDGEYLTYRLTEEAVRFIRDNRDGAFFLYFPHYAVHTPLQAPDSLVNYYKDKVKSSMRHRNAIYAAMIHSVDQSVGTIIEVLKDEGIYEHTAIFFTSDNGGLELREITENAPLRAGKGSAYEGGVRVPFIARVPGLTISDAQCTMPVITMDIFTTILSLSGSVIPENDGRDLTQILADPTRKWDAPSLYWHYPHYHPGGASPYSAVRKGDLRLVEFHEDNRMELYNLADDIGETHDLSEAQVEKALELRNDLHDWRSAMNAQMPIPNPDYKTENSNEHDAN